VVRNWAPVVTSLSVVVRSMLYLILEVEVAKEPVLEVVLMAMLVR
jgi:hypothetical protein